MAFAETCRRRTAFPADDGGTRLVARTTVPLLVLMMTLAALLAGASSAQAKSYRLINCPVIFGQDHYAVTPFAPGCAFGKAAYHPMVTFTLETGEGTVAVVYKRRTYRLKCAVTGELVQCGVGGKPYVRLYEDSGYAPPGSRWPTHT